MRIIMAIAMAGALTTWIANPALAAKRHHDQSSSTAVHKTEPAGQDPYAPGQQRYKADRPKKKSKTS